MKCLVLAAGYATRLYPLTENFPKPLLEVKGKTILDWLLDDLESSCLVEETIVITNSKYSSIFKDWAANRTSSSAGSKLLPAAVAAASSQVAVPKPLVLDDGTSTNEGRLGAVKDIAFAVERLAIDGDALVMAGDNLLDFSLARFIDYSIAKGTSCVMRFHQPDPARLRKSGVLEIDDDDRVIGMEEKPEKPRSNWSCPPFYFLKGEDLAKVVQAISQGCGTDAPGSFISWLSSKTVVHAMEMPGRRFDIGTLETYERIRSSYPGIGTVELSDRMGGERSRWYHQERKPVIR